MNISFQLKHLSCHHGSVESTTKSLAFMTLEQVETKRVLITIKLYLVFIISSRFNGLESKLNCSLLLFHSKTCAVSVRSSIALLTFYSSALNENTSLFVLGDLRKTLWTRNDNSNVIALLKLPLHYLKSIICHWDLFLRRRKGHEKLSRREKFRNSSSSFHHFVLLWVYSWGFHLFLKKEKCEQRNVEGS